MGNKEIGIKFDKLSGNSCQRKKKSYLVETMILPLLSYFFPYGELVIFFIREKKNVVAICHATYFFIYCK